MFLMFTMKARETISKDTDRLKIHCEKCSDLFFRKMIHRNWDKLQYIPAAEQLI